MYYMQKIYKSYRICLKISNLTLRSESSALLNFCFVEFLLCHFNNTDKPDVLLHPIKILVRGTSMTEKFKCCVRC